MLDELISKFDPNTKALVPDDFVTMEECAPKEVRAPLMPFQISPEQVSNITITKVPIAASTFIRRINKVLDRNTTKPIREKDITGWLAQKGFIKEHTIQIIKDDKEYLTTEQASSIGLLLTSRSINNGQADKHFIRFSGASQQFILDNIDDIAEYARNNQ